MKNTDLEQTANEIMGTSKTESQIIDEYDLDIDATEFLEKMLDYNIQYCDGCGTWKECCEFNEEDVDYCLVCSPEDE